MGIPSSASTTPLSPLGEACLRTDLTAIHEIVEKLGYKDDEGAATEVPFLTPNFFLFILVTVSLQVLGKTVILVSYCNLITFLFCAKCSAFVPDVDQPDARLAELQEKG